MLPPGWRHQALAHLDETFDLVIVGGGITGCGVLQESAQRGLAVLLVERGDVGCGTSSRSSKLVHGGLRYLRQLDFRLTRRSCHERDRMLRLNPELVHPLSFVYPLRREDSTPAWVMGAGLWLYDRFTAPEHRHRRLEPAEARQLAPRMDLEEGDTAFAYRDGWADDARLTLAVAATGVAAGGFLLTRAAAVGFLSQPTGRISGVVVEDGETGASHEVRAHLVVNAAGVWVDQLRGRAGVEGRRLRPSRGSHLVLPSHRLPLEGAVAGPHPRDRRPVFCIPHPEGVLVGTTDLFHRGSLDDPRPTPEETSYLLEAVRSFFPGRRLGPGDVVGSFAGLRPILDDSATEPSEASRDEAIWEERGLLTVAGGKLTTWRTMAREAVDEALGHLPPERARRAGESISAGTPLVGWAPVDLGDRLAALWPRQLGAPPEVARAAARRLRGAAPWMPGMARDRRELEPLAPGLDLSVAEVRTHLAWGGVLRLEDLLLRRVRLGMWEPRQAAELLSCRKTEAALRKIFGEEMGWDEERWGREEEAFARALEAWGPVEPGA